MADPSLINKPNVVKDQIITSPFEGMFKPSTVSEGSLYREIYASATKWLAKEGDWIWLNYVLDGSTITASEGIALGQKMAVLFKRRGFRQGDSVHICVGNHNMCHPTCFGVWILGGVPSVGDCTLEGHGIAGQLNDTKSKFIFCIPETADLVKEAVRKSKKGPDEITIFCYGDAPGCENILTLIDDINPEDAPEPYTCRNPREEPCVVFWSSGTTGFPKGIVHSHFSAMNFGGFLAAFLQPNTPAVTTTCFFHVGGFYTGLYAFMLRQDYHHMFGPSFTLEHLINTIIKIKPSAVAIGTHHYIQMAESSILDEKEPEDFASVKLLLPAGAAVPSSCEAKLRNKFMGLKGVMFVYGQTEAGVATSGVSVLHLGTVLPCYRVKIENIRTGERCKLGEEGEICLKSPWVMLEYLNRPKQTAEVFDFEGFVHTGDIGYYNEKGEIYYVDRLKELIKWRNTHISPTELEDIMQSHPAVQECLIFGKPHRVDQEHVTAVVVKNEGYENVLENELTEHVNSKVAEFKKIRGGIIFRNELPRNSVGKLVRREMREWARSLAK